MKRVEKYVDDILSGELVTNILTKKAVKRFISDLKRPEFIYDYQRAQDVLDFLDELILYEGPAANQPMKVEPYFAFAVANVWGFWHKDTGNRRFQYIYQEVARKNAKSMYMAGIGLLCTRYDGESGSQVFSIATNYEQAYESFIKELRLGEHPDNCLIDGMDFKVPISTEPRGLIALQNGRKIGESRPLAHVPKKHDGLNPYLTKVEEYHAHPTDAFYRVMKSAMGSRPNQMLWIITTAGDSLESPCYTEHMHACAVLNGTAKGDTDSYFAIIHNIDQVSDFPITQDIEVSDDWEDERNWIKANPALGTTKDLKKMRDQFSQTAKSPTEKVEFRCKQLGIWGEEASSWFYKDVVEANVGEKLTPEQWEILRGRICAASIDAGNTKDLTALTFEFRDPFGDGKDLFVSYNFVPEGALEKDNENADKYKAWQEEDWLEITPGQMSDNSAIIEQILACEKVLGFVVHEVNYDPTFLKDAAKILEEDHGFKMIPFKQTRGNYTSPINAMEAKMLTTNPKDCNEVIGGYSCGGNPMSAWQLRNIRLKTFGDFKMPAKPDNPMSPRKIDTVVTMIMCEELMPDLPLEAPQPWSGSIFS